MRDAVRSIAVWWLNLDARAAELVLAGSALAFGAALLVPVDLGTRSPAFRVLVEMLPQPVWAGIWIVLGAAQFAGSVWDYGRRQADVAVACLWVFWTVVQVLYLGATLGPFSYGWLALCSIAASHLHAHRE